MWSLTILTPVAPQRTQELPQSSFKSYHSCVVCLAIFLAFARRSDRVSPGVLLGVPPPESAHFAFPPAAPEFALVALNFLAASFSRTARACVKAPPFSLKNDLMTGQTDFFHDGRSHRATADSWFSSIGKEPARQWCIRRSR